MQSSYDYKKPHFLRTSQTKCPWHVHEQCFQRIIPRFKPKCIFLIFSPSTKELFPVQAFRIGQVNKLELHYFHWSNILKPKYTGWKMQLLFYSFDQFIKYFGVYLVVDEKQFLHASLISTTKGVCETVFDTLYSRISTERPSSILFIVVFRQKYSQIQAQIEILQSFDAISG